MDSYEELLDGESLSESFDPSPVLSQMGTDPARLIELIECLGSDREIVRARACAILERYSRSHPDVAQKAKDGLLLLFRAGENWLVKMNVARMAPLVTWEEDEYEAVLNFLFEEVAKESGFVAAWALDSLARLATIDDSIRPRVKFLLEEARDTGSASVRARARKNHIALFGR